MRPGARDLDPEAYGFLVGTVFGALLALSLFVLFPEFFFTLIPTTTTTR